MGTLWAYRAGESGAGRRAILAQVPRAAKGLLGAGRLSGQGSSAHGLRVEHPPLVVAHPRLVVREEDLADELTAAAHAGLLEHALEVLLDGVGRDVQSIGDL